MKLRAPLIALALLLSCMAGFAEQRFPPPEFETVYEMPHPTTPAARHLALQYLDLAVLAAALGVAIYLIYRKRSRAGLVGLSIFSVVYFGFYRKGCVCSIGSLQNVALALGDNSYALPLTIGAFFALPLLVALLAGRAFCSGVCPHGALQDLLLVKPVKVPLWLEQGLGVLPFVYLGGALLFAATGSAFLICEYDPFVPFFRRGGSFLMLSIGAGFLVTSVFVGRPYCRFLCPYGALLRLASLTSKWRVTVTPTTCTSCRLCEQSCPYGALRQPIGDPAPAGLVARNRRQFSWLLLALPAVLITSAWIGFQAAGALSRRHPTVALAERLPGSSPIAIQPGNQVAADLSLARAQQNPGKIMADAVEIRRRFNTGGWMLGGWVAVVVGVKLTSTLIYRRRTDYEPDRGACVACARCFASCPAEQVRRGNVGERPSGLNPPGVAALPPL